ncbi:MAG: mechanosensitive ion channel family protein [Fimbriimonadaceae bacterium]|nr:mechanosensitive ion channel family protein [Fimbriimonadaceae bacterium]
MAKRGRFALVLLAFLLLLAGALGQPNLVGPPSPPSVADPAAARVLDGPRATFRTFFEAMAKEDLPRAVETLDLSDFPAVETESRGPRLAKMLLAVLNRLEYVRVAAIPATSEGAFTFRTVRDAAGETVGTIEVAPGTDGAWRFTAHTVASLNDMWEAVREQPIVFGTDPDEFAFAPAQWFRRRVPEALHREIAGLLGYQWLGLLGLLALFVLVDRATRALIKAGASLALRAFHGSLDDAIRFGVRRNAGRVAGATAVLYAVPFLGYPLPISAVLTGAFVLVRIAAGAFAVHFLTQAVTTAIQERALRFGARTGRLVVPFLTKVLDVVIVLGALVVVLAAFGINVSAILAGLGIGGLVVAFAAKDSIENVFGSLTILFDMPFAVGDWVIIGTIDGEVEEINLRSTRIRTFDDSIITLPNSNLIKASVENMGRRRYRRFRTTIGVVHGTPPEKLAEFCDRVRDNLRTRGDVWQERVRVSFYDVGDSSLDVLLSTYFEVPGYDAELESRAQVLGDILRIANEMGVSLAYPTRTVRVENAADAAQFGA